MKRSQRKARKNELVDTENENKPDLKEVPNNI